MKDEDEDAREDVEDEDGREPGDLAGNRIARRSEVRTQVSSGVYVDLVHGLCAHEPVGDGDGDDEIKRLPIRTSKRSVRMGV